MIVYKESLNQALYPVSRYMILRPCWLICADSNTIA